MITTTPYEPSQVRLRAGRSNITELVVLGALGGLTWAAALRGWMADFAQDESRFTWMTFGLLMIPGLLVGGLISVAEARRRAGLAPHRWLVLSPALFLVALLDPQIFAALIRNGQGGGAIGLVSFALAGGYALSGRGRAWARVLAGAYALLGLLLCFAMGQQIAAEGTVHAIWNGLYLTSLTALLILAALVPHLSSARRDMSVLTYVALGALGGLAWACTLRGFMSQIAGEDSQFTWAGTFGFVLLPGAVIGGSLGWAEHLRRTGGRKGWRTLVLTPLLFGAVLVPGLLHPDSFLGGGIGAGALALPVIAIIGGAALSGRGPRWRRACCAALALASIPIWALTATAVGGPSFTLTSPHGLWAALLYYCLIGTFSLAASAPQRRIVTNPT